MAAVLQAALDDVHHGKACPDTLAWVTSTDRVWPFSFENLCDALDLNAGEVRRKLTGGGIVAVHC